MFGICERSSSCIAPSACDLAKSPTKYVERFVGLFPPPWRSAIRMSSLVWKYFALNLTPCSSSHGLATSGMS